MDILVMGCLKKPISYVALVYFIAVSASVKGADNLSSAVSTNPDKPGLEETWRDANHGGFNALYFFLKVYGDSRPYNECLMKMQNDRLPQTLSDMLAAAESLGHPLQAIYASPEQLKTLNLPVIVHVEGDTAANGYFFVILQDQGQRVVYLDGPSAAVYTMDKELFLRRWSGVAVIPYSRKFWIDAAFAAAFGAVGGLGLVLFCRSTAIFRRFYVLIS
jgi:hypothetical protein